MAESAQRTSASNYQSTRQPECTARTCNHDLLASPKRSNHSLSPGLSLARQGLSEHPQLLVRLECGPRKQLAAHPAVLPDGAQQGARSRLLVAVDVGLHLALLVVQI